MEKQQSKECSKPNQIKKTSKIKTLTCNFNQSIKLCNSNNVAYQICINGQCTELNPFICNQQHNTLECLCQIVHKKCIKYNFQSFKQVFTKQNILNKSMVDLIQKNTDMLIDKISIYRDKLIQRINKINWFNESSYGQKRNFMENNLFQDNQFQNLEVQRQNQNSSVFQMIININQAINDELNKMQWKSAFQTHTLYAIECIDQYFQYVQESVDKLRFRIFNNFQNWKIQIQQAGEIYWKPKNFVKLYKFYGQKVNKYVNKGLQELHIYKNKINNFNNQFLFCNQQQIQNKIILQQYQTTNYTNNNNIQNNNQIQNNKLLIRKTIVNFYFSLQEYLQTIKYHNLFLHLNKSNHSNINHLNQQLFNQLLLIKTLFKLQRYSEGQHIIILSQPLIQILQKIYIISIIFL